ncbi:hypothetical protein EXIGLDRAFT_766470 [Exidia glandulosa HHB12029]|uniref:DUF1746 domain-containing protein n=1 Tax=Exidia glandulosa HHB12029 TaxID=1314781 RepID=A0A165JQW0_EXIGL|nr:hypothetical protein EXIGLDRAFT_766470 [Exidia glandulosa HHB12029]
MKHAGQRKHIVSELSVVGYELLVLSFLLHPTVFDLVVRAFAQFAAARPTILAPDRSLRLWLLTLVAIHGHALVALAVPLSTSKGIVLDFIGNEHTPSRLLVLLVNLLVLLLQVVQICITHELATGANTLRGMALDSDLGSDAVLQLDFRATLKRVTHPPQPLELPAPATTGAGTDVNQLRRRFALTTVLRDAMARQLEAAAS